jgi:hypothetical protein
MTVCIFSGVLLGANMIAMLSMRLVSPLMYTREHEEFITTLFSDDVFITPVLTFLIPTIISIIYLLPIYKTVYKKEILFIAKKRLLNSPLVLGLVSLIGWGVAFLSYFFQIYIHDLPLHIEPAIKFLIEMFITGSVCFVVIYFLLEFINRNLNSRAFYN